MIPVWYIVIVVIIAVLSSIIILVCMVEYNDVRNKHDNGDKYSSRVWTKEDVERSRKDVRYSLLALLMSPVWPMIAVSLVGLGLFKAARVAVGKD